MPPTHLFLHVIISNPSRETLQHYHTLKLRTVQGTRPAWSKEEKYVHTCAYVLKTVWIIENYASSRSPRRNLIKDRPRNGFERGTARIALSLAFTFASLLGTPKCLPASLICTRLLPIKLSYRKGKPTFTRLNDRAFYPSFESRTDQEYLENSRLWNFIVYRPDDFLLLYHFALSLVASKISLSFEGLNHE